MLKWLLKSLLILAVFVPFATALPVAALWLCRTPDGAEFLFWAGPWSCCFWVLILQPVYAATVAAGAEPCIGGARRTAGCCTPASEPRAGCSVLCSSLRCGVHDALPFSSLAVRQSTAPGLHLQPFGVRLDMEARPWVRSSNSASPGG